jgi:hypothetical protein
MDRDEFFKLAVQLTAATLPDRFLSAPQTIPATSLTLCVAYNSILDAYSKIPERGMAPTT